MGVMVARLASLHTDTEPNRLRADVARTVGGTGPHAQVAPTRPAGDAPLAFAPTSAAHRRWGAAPDDIVEAECGEP